MAYGAHLGNNGIGSNNSTITYCDATFQYNIISYPDIISYNRIFRFGNEWFQCPATFKFTHSKLIKFTVISHHVSSKTIQRMISTHYFYI